MITLSGSTPNTFTGTVELFDGNTTLVVDTGGFAVGYDASAPKTPGNVDVSNGHRPTAAEARFGIPDLPATDTNHDGQDDRSDPLFGGLRSAGEHRRRRQGADHVCFHC